MPTYSKLYEELDSPEEVIAKNQFDLEADWLSSFLGTEQTNQDKFIKHSTLDMFTEPMFKNTYKTVLTYYEQYKKIDVDDLINLLYLTEKNTGLISVLGYLKDRYLTSSILKNLTIKLYNSYKIRLEKQCTSMQEFKKAEKILEDLKISEDEDASILECGCDFLLDYDNKKQNIIKTGYQSIDNLIGGLYGGNILLIAGATGCGKTCMTINIMLKMILSGRKVLFFNLEMSKEELTNRIIAIQTGLDSAKIRNRNMYQSELDEYAKYIDSEEFSYIAGKLELNTNPNVTVEDIAYKVKKSNADVICIDYLGLIGGDNKNGSYEKVSEISRRLKVLSNEVNKPIILLHQLNRDNKNRQDKRPTLSDIRDSGKIEQDMDFVTFVYRPNYYDTTQPKDAFEFIVAKSRHTGGANKIASLKFCGSSQRITERY